MKNPRNRKNSNPQTRRNAQAQAVDAAAAKKNPMDRIKDLEDMVTGLHTVARNQESRLVQAQDDLEQVGGTVAKLARTLNALVDLYGYETVCARVDQQASKEMQAAQAAALDAGHIKRVDAVTPASAVVIRETSKAGVVVRPGCAMLTFGQLVPEMQAAVLGQSVGFVFVHPDQGWKAEVLEVFEPVPEVQATPTELATEVTQAQAEAVTGETIPADAGAEASAGRAEPEGKLLIGDFGAPAAGRV